MVRRSEWAWVFFTAAAIVARGGTAARGDEAPPPVSPPPPAADGTTSVVVPGGNPSATPVTPPVATAPSAPPPTTTQPPQAEPAASDAANLLGELLEPLAGRTGAPPLSPGTEQLYIRPLPLLEALERSGDRSRRLWIAQAYWKVSAAYAQVRSSTEAIERLELIAPGGDPHDRATLDVAAAAARADSADARAQLGAAQQELVDLARLPLSEPLPWPVDRPLAGAYQTHFDAIFAARTATGRVRAIARTLPARHEALESRAAAVRAATRAMEMAEADHAKGKRPIEAVIAAHEALVRQQREFLLATKAYNLDIAEYAMAVADLAMPDDRFVSMLIGTPIQWRQQPAAAAPPAAP
jgi:outer membrane protein TolC